MSKYGDFRKLSGFDSYLPSLKEAQASSEYLDVGEVPMAMLQSDMTRQRELGTSDEVLEGKRLRELKLGITTSTLRDPGASDIYAKTKSKPKKGETKPSPSHDHKIEDVEDEQTEELDPHHMTAPELAAHSGRGHAHHHDHGKDHNEYFAASGKAHHVAQQAHEFSAMMKSGELPKDKHHHGKAHDLHLQAYTNHKIAGAMADKLGHSAQRNAHNAESSKHQDALAKHGKKIGKEY